MQNTDKIAQLLAGAYEDPEGYGPQRVTTKALTIAPSLKGMERDLVKQLEFGRKLAVVSDNTTHHVLGRQVERALEGSFTVQSLVLGDAPHPDDVTVAAIRAQTGSADALIAIGSGTINDLCKYASAQDHKPYAVFATAPSMNGYVSVNAAITEHGHKMSLPAQAPRGAFFDLAILAAAPARLIRSGLGDSLCRSTSQADWLLAHLLLDQPYRQLPYALLQDDEKPLFDAASALMAGDLAIMERLVRTLVLSGFGTAIIGNSKPASQGEHLISHFIDMFGDEKRPLIYHGEQIGVTTLSMARLQEEGLKVRPRLAADTISQNDFIAEFGPEIGRSCWDEFRQKSFNATQTEALNARIAKDWGHIVERIAAISYPVSYLENVLKDAGAPTMPQQIHLERGFYERALRHCREIRNRFTFLDLAAKSRLLDARLGAL